MTTQSVQHVFVLGPDALTDAEAKGVLRGAVVARSETATIEVSGSGAVDCLQGLLTNDVVAPGDRAFMYGALLTQKGMIVTDLWAARTDPRVLISVPQDGKADLLETFKRTLPPRLASFADRSDDLDVIRLVGPESSTVASAAGFVVDEAGRISSEDDCIVATPGPQSPFALQITCPRVRRDQILQRLGECGAAIGAPAALELARIIEGWPRLGAEIDRKTLPQEVRYDDIGGVSHTKGCYVGQETVARIHFRGHVNRRMMGLLPEDTPDFAQTQIVDGDRNVGRVTSSAWVASLEAYVALCMVRREIEPESVVTAAGAVTKVVDLPFQFDTP